MKRKQALSKTSSGEQQIASTDDFTIYDVPGANLDIRGILRPLVNHSDGEVKKAATQSIDLLTKCIRAMGKDDVGLVLKED